MYTQASECVETLTSVLKELPEHGHPAQVGWRHCSLYPMADLLSNLYPHQSPLALHLLKDSSPSKALLCVQKLIHCNPTDVWALAALVYFLEQSSMPELKSRYHLVLQHQSKPISWPERLHDSPALKDFRLFCQN